MKAIDELKHRLEPLSVKEAARLYGDSVGNFYRKIRRGEIPGAFRERGKPRGRIKICVPTFVAWIEEQIAGGCGPPKVAAKSITDGSGTLSSTAPKAGGCKCENNVGLDRQRVG